HHRTRRGPDEQPGRTSNSLRGDAPAHDPRNQGREGAALVRAALDRSDHLCPTRSFGFWLPAGSGPSAFPRRGVPESADQLIVKRSAALPPPNHLPLPEIALSRWTPSQRSGERPPPFT